jgi:hypothetical protein
MSSVDAGQELALLREELAAFMATRQADELGLGSKSISRAEIVRGLLAAIGKTGGEHSTAKIARNAQGAPTFEVSVRTGESDAIATAADASAEALRLWRELDELLPFVKAATNAG